MTLFLSLVYDSRTLAVGTRFGPYEILGPVGSGGMGDVYRARDTRLDRLVAIKVLRDGAGDRTDWRGRFAREARTIASLNHPHICTLYDVGREDGVDHLVMEYLEGETLAARLTRGPLPLEQALRHAIAISDALDKAHRKGITHRDLKPGNIMITKAGPKLLDFRPRERAAGGCAGPVALRASDGHGAVDRGGNDSRHPPIHGAGTARRQGGRCPNGPVRLRRRLVRDGHG